ncbi:MAG: bifunctional aspartate kinase/homoserine dehydrogenase I [Acidobacteria bacterium]|nr:bifunctional aspartate kinase/homoserine dehydrogenase I [Acidobacteriota bacterium]
MKVLKFGGSSVAGAERISNVATLVKAASETDRIAVVLSALQGTTDRLIEAGRLAESGDDGYLEKIHEIASQTETAVSTLFPAFVPVELSEFIDHAVDEVESICEGVRRVGELSGRTLDRILSFGELVSSRILYERLTNEHLSVEWVDSRKMIRTDKRYGSAVVDINRTYSNLQEHIASSESRILIFPGFIGSAADGSTTTLGRGGSDYTAALVAAAVDADLLEIWTDVSGMMSADPRYVRNVRQIPSINYLEAMELSHFGAKVLYPPTIQPVMAKGIPLRIKNTFQPADPGTLVEAVSTDRNDIIRGISSIDGITVLSLEGSGMVGVPGFSKRLFDALSRAGINVVLITQSSSEHSICVAVEERFATLAKEVVDTEFEGEISFGKIDPLRVESGFSILAIVGDNMKEHTGVSGRMFMTLGHNGINIHAIAQGSSERNISAVIATSDVRKAVNSLHEEFFSDGRKQVNVFIAGVGTVGSRLIGQIRQQTEHLSETLRLNIRVVGIARSNRAVVADEGIELEDVTSRIENAGEMSISEFADEIIGLNLRNSVFVDVTASEDVVAVYSRLLAKSISVVACNKIACSSGFERYRELKSLASEFNSNFLFETNVGAGLPVINTLNDLIRSGDRIHRIEAVLSGTLNFVFNNYDGSEPFADVVRRAQAEGYTEPDPRLDLSGTDVARKILILARESGNSIEMEDVAIDGFLPETCLSGSVEDFYSEMLKQESVFKGLFESAASEGKMLKFIASLDGGRASIGLRAIGPEHDFARLSGKDNAVLFYTSRYSEQPLVVKGAGAGADVTAAGVFADIIRAART